MKPPVTPRKPVATAPAHGRASRQSLIDELQLHRDELAQQNEELSAAQLDLAAARDRYVDLFDHAPVGYLALDAEGCITEANLTAAGEFGVDRHAMLGLPFVRFMVSADIDRWQRLQALTLRRGDPARIELRLRRRDGRPFDAQLDTLRVRQPAAAVQLRVTITDVSQRRMAERHRRIAVRGNLARATERRRMAHGLHEDLGQRLCALKVMLATLEEAPAGSALHRTTAATMATQLDDSIAVVRRLCAELHPLILDNLGLAAAMEWLLSHVGARLGLAVGLHMDSAPLVDDDAAITIYRLAEELLEGFAGHVMGDVTVDLLQRPHDLVVEVRCTPLCSMTTLLEAIEPARDQALLVAGRLEVDEAQTGDCRIRVFLPIAAAAAAQADVGTAAGAGPLQR